MKSVLLAKFCIILAVQCISLLLPAVLLAAEPVEVVVEGVEDEALDNVNEALALPPGLVNEDRVDRAWLERFAAGAESKALEALKPFGYYNAQVHTTLESVGDDEYRLLVKVTPGEPVVVDEVKVEIKGPATSEPLLLELMDEFPLEKGDDLLQPSYDEAKGGLLSRAQELGYLDATFPLHEIRIDRERKKAKIGLILDSGGKYSFGDVRIEGAPDYPERFLRRYLTIKKESTFSYARLGESQLNFANSERFKEVVITPEKESAVDYRVPVLVQLKPVPRRSIRPGAGYGTDTGGRFSLRFRDLNVFHMGHEFNANLFLAQKIQGLALNYSLPGYRNLRTSTSVQLNLQREDVSTYVSRLVGVEFNWNYGVTGAGVVTAYVKMQQEDFTVGNQESSSRLVLPGIRYGENRFDSLIRPTRGYRFSADFRGTHQYLGSDTSFLQFVGEAGHVQPLPWRLSLHTRTTIGLTLLKDSFSELPPAMRFFAGGDHSVRGYTYQSLGPRDSSGKVVGGNHLFFASMELERALFKNWGVSVFYDGGNAFDNFPEVRFAQGAGLGLHYYTPVGALNLSVARQIDEPQPAIHIHFTVGFEL